MIIIEIIINRVTPIYDITLGTMKGGHVPMEPSEMVSAREATRIMNMTITINRNARREKELGRPMNRNTARMEPPSMHSRHGKIKNKVAEVGNYINVTISPRIEVSSSVGWRVRGSG